MFGFIHESIRQLMLRKYGEELWNNVLIRAGFEAGKENIINHYYADADTFLLVDCVSALTKVPKEAVWEMYGAFLIEYTMEIGWDELIRCMSPDLKGFLDSLDALHYFIDHVVYKANLRGPSFRAEQNPDGTIVLHYYTGRPGLHPIVKGVLHEVARRVFQIELSTTIAGRTQRSVQMNTGERVEEHVIFHIVTSDMKPVKKDDDMIRLCVDEEMRLNGHDLAALLPYHFIMDDSCRIVHYGQELSNHIPRALLTVGTPIIRMFEINRPQIPFDFDNICNFINAVFVMQVKASPADMRRQREGQTVDELSDISMHGQHLKLKGQMMILSSGRHIIYLCSPYVVSIPELMQFGMRLTAMPLHDATRDLILLNQQRLTDVEVNLQLEANNEQLELMSGELESEREQMDAILRDMLPESIAQALLAGEQIASCEYSSATAMFTDIPNFPNILVSAKPKDIVTLLNVLFVKFDHLIAKFQVYKVETIGDTYMVVSGIRDSDPQHAEHMCHAALGFLWESRAVADPHTKRALQLRIGIHSGPLVAGVIKSKSSRYSLFGDTVVTASKMEASGLPGKIHCSSTTKMAACSTGRFQFELRGKIQIKDRGEMETYFLTSSLKKSIWEIVGRERDVNVNSIEGYEELITGQDCSKDETIITVTGDNNISKSCAVM